MKCKKVNQVNKLMKSPKKSKEDCVNLFFGQSDKLEDGLEVLTPA